MAAKNRQGEEAKKRKHIAGANKTEPGASPSKKRKLDASKTRIPPNKGAKKPFKPSKPPIRANLDNSKEDKAPLTKREGRLKAKELAEARKKKRKRHYNLEQELASLWERMRVRNIAKEDRSKFITEALQKMKGKIPEIAGSHVSSRVLQTCVKFCSQSEKDAVFEELRPHFLTLACNTYAVHLVKKMLDNASKKQLAGFISSLRGHVASLLRHMVGSVVIEHAYQQGNATQRQELLMELYSTELQLFKDLTLMKESRLLDVMSKLGLQKASVLRHLSLVIQPILEKGIVDHSIIHRVLIEYLTIADKSSAAEVIEQLSGPLLVRMIHTRDGSRLGMLCVKHGSAKERKKIVKGMKSHISKIAHDQYGSMVLVCIVSTVDDTKLVTKIVLRELQTILKELVFDRNGRRVLLQLLHPNCSRYLSPDDLASLDSNIPTLCAKGEFEVNSEAKSSNDEESSNKDETIPESTAIEANDGSSLADKIQSVEGGKKNPSLRRKELLVDGGFAENLIKICIEHAGELLRSNFGKEVLYEVAIGGSDSILHPALDDKLNTLHEAISSLAAESKSEDSEEEHVLENFHSSRTIRNLVLDCPSFASTLWKTALEGKCELWAQGHSCKVVSAFLESTHPEVQKLARKELQPLVDGGALKISETKKATKEG
ncbi:putative Penguin [Tripterygium wilfordii]|uniref:Putative Penguin n=1 Tax=Tripterygium wilfordii TaxID=458696 RepID=A0A7J7CSE0_TRIWF|nr:pumilio homolog 24-like [Tripterygium wilfordii]KAF5737025.1 putative Penguin [Tripterygium wilfordii]